MESMVENWIHSEDDLVMVSTIIDDELELIMKQRVMEKICYFLQKD